MEYLLDTFLSGIIKEQTQIAMEYGKGMIKLVTGWKNVLQEAPQRLIGYIGRVSKEDMKGIEEALSVSLGIEIPVEIEAP